MFGKDGDKDKKQEAPKESKESKKEEDPQESSADSSSAEEAAEDSGRREMIERVNKKVMPHITDLKNEIREMQRETEGGNLYSVYEPNRLSKKEMD